MEKDISQQILNELQKINNRLGNLENDVSEIKEHQKIDAESIDLILANTKDIKDELRTIDSATKINSYDIVKLRSVR